MISTAVIKDIESISDLIRQCINESIAQTLSEEGLNHLFNHTGSSSILDYYNQGYQFYKFSEELDIVGVAAIKPPSHLFYLFVASAHQGRGVGTRLWSHIRKTIHQAGGVSTPITVNSSLNAVPFYLRLGFEISGPVNSQYEVKCQPMKYIP